MKFLSNLFLTVLSFLLSVPALCSLPELPHLVNNDKPYNQEQEDISKRLVRIPPQNIPLYSSECSAIQVNQTSYLTNRHCAEQLTYTLQKQVPAQLEELQQSTHISAQNKPSNSADDAHDLVYLTTSSRHNNREKQAPIHPLALYHSVPDDDTIFHGRVVTYWSNSSEETDAVFVQMKAELSYCDKDYCYLQYSSHNNGNPFFLDNQLLCIGLKDSSLCRRVQSAHHVSRREVSKREVSKREDGCTTTKSGNCTTKQCNAGVGDCSLCRDGKSCTIKDGDCDGQSRIRKLICSSGAQCTGHYSKQTPVSGTCMNVQCDKGACGKDCSASCSFRGSTDGDLCPDGDDYDCRGGISPWVIIGPIGGVVITMVISIVACSYYGYYKSNKRLNPPAAMRPLMINDYN